MPNPLHIPQMVQTARALNPHIEVIIRTHSENELQMLRKGALGTIFLAEEELAKNMAKYVIDRFVPQREKVTHSSY